MKRTAALLLALLTVVGPAQAGIIISEQREIVSKEVGLLLIEARTLIVAKKYKAALVKVKQAEAVKSSPDDGYVIDQMRQSILAFSLDPIQP